MVETLISFELLKKVEIYIKMEHGSTYTSRSKVWQIEGNILIETASIGTMAVSLLSKVVIKIRQDS